MPLQKKAVLGILSDNLRRRGSVLPLSRRLHTRWARGLGIPLGGETVIYTGQMYQLIPAISKMARRMASLEDSWLTRVMGAGRVVNKVLNISWFLSRARRRERAVYDSMLRDIALLLRASGVEFGYLYGDDMYTGALVHDQGVDSALAAHARRVVAALQAHGVKRLITVDPHTTHMLRSVYPQLIEGFEIEVRSYLEILDERGLVPREMHDGPVVVHDSCVYARYESVVDSPRRLLTSIGAAVVEPELSGVWTHCCGGPIESLFPRRAHEIAARRVEQLAESLSTAHVEAAGRGEQGERSQRGTVAVMCPICLVNLTGAAEASAGRYRDISRLLADSVIGDRARWLARRERGQKALPAAQADVEADPGVLPSAP